LFAAVGSGDVSDMDADVQNEEETMLVEEPSQEGETGTMHEEEEQGHQQGRKV
jgi:hypothetical protein